MPSLYFLFSSLEPDIITGVHLYSYNTDTDHFRNAGQYTACTTWGFEGREIYGKMNKVYG